MKILLLTQYFPPEIGAPQNRLHSLASYLSGFGAEVTVLTAMPSYPQSELHAGYKHKWFKKETDGKLTIFRSWIYVTKSKAVFPRLLNYFSFVFTSFILGIFFIRRRDVIICESPPLFLGITALLLKWIKSSKLVFNVSDLWPESAEKLDIISNKTMLSLSYALEGFIYKNANLVSGQTQGIINSIESRFPATHTHLMRNGIDIKQFNHTGNRTAFRTKCAIGENDFVVGYAGIIGHAQGLEIVIRAADKLKHIEKLTFLFVGNGPDKDNLMALTNQLSLKNIRFLNSVPRTEMPDVIAACDCYVTPLRKNDLFLGAIPSKIFEPLYYQKPVIMGVNGEAKELFVDQGKCVLHFEPENLEQLTAAINQLMSDQNLYDTLGRNGKTYVTEHFDREKLAFKFWERLQTTV
jgi:glycosyltransferase involved in cell wall biosynthesis